MNMLAFRAEMLSSSDDNMSEGQTCSFDGFQQLQCLCTEESLTPETTTTWNIFKWGRKAEQNYFGPIELVDLDDGSPEPPLLYSGFLEFLSSSDPFVQERPDHPAPPSTPVVDSPDMSLPIETSLAEARQSIILAAPLVTPANDDTPFNLPCVSPRPVDIGAMQSMLPDTLSAGSDDGSTRSSSSTDSNTDDVLAGNSSKHTEGPHVRHDSMTEGLDDSIAHVEDNHDLSDEADFFDVLEQLSTV